MNRICWWVVNYISGALPGDEQDVLLGDIAELGLSGSQALHETLGLVARRQAAPWQDWRPWLAVFGLAGLVGSRLTRISFWIGTVPGLPLFIRWKYGVHYGNGLSAPEEAVVFLCQSLALISWSWTAGFVLGLLSRRTLWINVSLFYSICFLFWAPRAFPIAETLARSLLIFFGIVFVLGLLSRRTLWINVSLFYFICFLFWPARALTIGETLASLPIIFFGIELPVILQTVFFFLPSFAGLKRAIRRGTLTTGKTCLLSAAIIVLTALATWTEGWQQAAHLAWSGGIWPHEVIRWPSRLWPYLLVSWPIAYVFVATLGQRWRRQPA